MLWEQCIVFGRRICDRRVQIPIYVITFRFAQILWEINQSVYSAYRKADDLNSSVYLALHNVIAASLVEGRCWIQSRRVGIPSLFHNHKLCPDLPFQDGRADLSNSLLMAEHNPDEAMRKDRVMSGDLDKADIVCAGFTRNYCPSLQTRIRHT